MADFDPKAPVTLEHMFTLAKRFRTKAEWECRDGWYDDTAEKAKNSAMKEVYEGVANEIDNLFDFDSGLTREELLKRSY